MPWLAFMQAVSAQGALELCRVGLGFRVYRVYRAYRVCGVYRVRLADRLLKGLGCALCFIFLGFPKRVPVRIPKRGLVLQVFRVF